MTDNKDMDAYYYSFSPTGVKAIDEILRAVAWAGKGSHHTEDWTYAGYTDTIQSMANSAAEKFVPKCTQDENCFCPDWCVLEATQESLREYMALVKERGNEILRLRGLLAEIREVYVGTEGFHANTASEVYQEGIIYKMYEIAVGREDSSDA